MEGNNVTTPTNGSETPESNAPAGTAAEAGATPATPPDGAGATPAGAPDATSEPSFDEWLAEQSEEIRTRFEGRIHALAQAYERTKEERNSLKKQLKEIGEKKDGDARADVQALTERLELSERRSEFVEAAVTAGCTNPRLAWLAAQDEQIDLAEVRKRYPELFRQRVATGAGAGTAQPPAPAQSMNDYIRAAARKRGV